MTVQIDRRYAVWGKAIDIPERIAVADGLPLYVERMFKPGAKQRQRNVSATSLAMAGVAGVVNSA